MDIVFSTWVPIVSSVFTSIVGYGVYTISKLVDRRLEHVEQKVEQAAPIEYVKVVDELQVARLDRIEDKLDTVLEVLINAPELKKRKR